MAGGKGLACLQHKGFRGQVLALCFGPISLDEKAPVLVSRVAASSTRCTFAGCWFCTFGVIAPVRP